MRRRFPFPGPNGFPFSPRRQAFEAQIQQAHQFFEAGDYLQSAQLFDELAQIAAARNGPRAPRFYIQAGRACLHAGKVQEGMLRIEKGYQLFLQTGRADAATQVGWRLTGELKALGLEAQAREVASWFGGTLPPLPAANSHPPLPLKCPSCGAPVYPDEVTWLDVHTAQCEFCGNPMRGDSVA